MTRNTARILVVDDEEKIRDMLKRGLGLAEYACTTVQSAHHAALLLEQEEFDLVLLDNVMPGKSGIEFLPEIKSQYSDMAVVMLTGVADVSMAVKAMRDGAHDYVSKPIALPELIIRIESALSRRALLRENRMYQRKLEEMVDELNARHEQRGRELMVLDNLVQSHINQALKAQKAYNRLRQALSIFSSEVQSIADLAGIIKADDEEAVDTT